MTAAWQSARPYSIIGQSGWGRGPIIVLIGFLPILAIASMTASMPVMLDHFVGVEGASVLVPLLVTAPALMIALLAPFAGMLVDRAGRRGPLIAACLLYGVAGCAPLLLDNLYAIIASRLLLGVAEAVLITVANTLLADYWEERGRRFWLTVQGVAGPFLASGVIATSGYFSAMMWNGVFFLYLLAFPLALGCYLLLADVPRSETDEHSAALAEAPSGWFLTMLPVLIATLVTTLLYYIWIVQGGLAFRAIGILSPARQGEIFAIAHLAVIGGALTFWVTARFLAPSGQAAIMLGAMGLGLILIGCAEEEQAMTIGLVLQQMAAGMSVPTLIAWGQKVLPPSFMGAGMGAWAAVFFAGQFLSPLIFASSSVVREDILARFAMFGGIGLASAAIVGILALAGVVGGRNKPTAPPGSK